jgi:predicted MPP superfamily phosphohydrolase
LNNDIVEFDNFTLLGLGSNWNREDDTSLLQHYSQDENIIVLTHNPDTTLKYDNNNADLTLAGHTHG